jgi:hypothetical protein
LDILSGYSTKKRDTQKDGILICEYKLFPNIRLTSKLFVHGLKNYGGWERMSHGEREKQIY